MVVVVVYSYSWFINDLDIYKARQSSQVCINFISLATSATLQSVLMAQIEMLFIYKITCLQLLSLSEL